MEKLIIKTKKQKGIVDITDKIAALVKAQKQKEGFCQLFVAHTTAALTTSYLDPKLELELVDAFEVEIPRFTTIRDQYAHNHHVAHLPSHVTAAYFGPSLSVPYKNGKLLLGEYQRIILIELNGPKKRQIIISL
ncbi:MAG: secondary thiamine-phosphate synthase enzyme YjbQ [Candidatus Curtissbacteria bacterium]|nr:secondary thiamine-phosphate synthase enzyme YjbQ [Candidatus Curtissbacteria bacterium]